jgi:hypothetical protein
VGRNTCKHWRQHQEKAGILELFHVG